MNKNEMKSNAVIEMHNLWEQVDSSSAEIARKRAGEICLKESIANLLLNDLVELPKDVHIESSVVDSMYNFLVTELNMTPEDLMASAIVMALECREDLKALKTPETHSDDKTKNIREQFSEKIQETKKQFDEMLSNLTPAEVLLRSEELNAKNNFIGNAMAFKDETPTQLRCLRNF